MPGLFRVYVDETGDRGWSPTSSPVFVLAAVVVPDELDVHLRLVRDQLCHDLGKPTATVLHWAENLRYHSHRKHAVRTLASTDVHICYVVVDKASFGASPPGGLRDHHKLYNYAMRRLLERLSWLARKHQRTARIEIAHIKNFKYETLREYLELLQAMGSSIDWHRIDRLRIRTPKDRVLLQFADIAAGALSAAVCADKFGSIEYAYLESLASRIYRHTPGKITTYGLHCMPDDAIVTTQPWWPRMPN